MHLKKIMFKKTQTAVNLLYNQAKTPTLYIRQSGASSSHQCECVCEWVND